MEIEKLMTKELIVGNITDTLYDIALLMKKYNIGFVPIAKGKQIIGVLTDRDIVINALVNKVKLDECIEEYMNVDLVTINQNETSEKALDAMGFKKVKRLIVEDNGKVVGIVSLSDLIKDPDIAVDAVIDNLRKLLENFESRTNEEAEIDDFYL